MAHTSSGKKSIRQSSRRRLINRRNVGILRSCTRNFNVECGNKDAEVKTLKDLFVKLQKVTARSVTRGILKKNTASRRISNANRKLKQVVLSR